MTEEPTDFVIAVVLAGWRQRRRVGLWPRKVPRAMNYVRPAFTWCWKSEA